MTNVHYHGKKYGTLGKYKGSNSRVRICKEFLINSKNINHQKIIKFRTKYFKTLYNGVILELVLPKLDLKHK